MISDNKLTNEPKCQTQWVQIFDIHVLLGRDVADKWIQWAKSSGQIQQFAQLWVPAGLEGRNPIPK